MLTRSCMLCYALVGKIWPTDLSHLLYCSCAQLYHVLTGTFNAVTTVLLRHWSTWSPHTCMYYILAKQWNARNRYGNLDTRYAGLRMSVVGIYSAAKCWTASMMWKLWISPLFLTEVNFSGNLFTAWAEQRVFCTVSGNPCTYNNIVALAYTLHVPTATSGILCCCTNQTMQRLHVMQPARWR